MVPSPLASSNTLLYVHHQLHPNGNCIVLPAKALSPQPSFRTMPSLGAASCLNPRDLSPTLPNSCSL